MEIGKDREIQNMGETTSTVFAGEELKSITTKEGYGETPRFFAEQIRQRLEPGEYTIADVGSHKGELLGKLLDLLPGYKFKTLGIDSNEQPLKDNPADQKVLAEAGQLPIETGGVDVSIVRYVLQWNNPEKQKKILGELARTVGKFALIEHGGSPSERAEEYREIWEKIYDGSEVAKMKRTGHFFSSAREIEQWMTEQGIRFERIKERRIDKMSSAYEERYNLNREELGKLREIVGDDDFYILTDWIIYPKG